VELVIEQLGTERLYRIKRTIEEELDPHARVSDH